jgi:PadR family transcriptional regulator, regulatory protein PadR
MTERSVFSAQTLAVLAALRDQPSEWRHGYALAKVTGLKSGTLYPILIRLADRGLVEACWQEEPRPGRPRRHLYRLTADGQTAAAAALAATTERVTTSERAARRGARAPLTGPGTVSRALP